MNDAFRELANGHFESGLDKLNQDPQWHDDRTDLKGPFFLGFPGARGWGEELLVASLLKREAVNLGFPVKVYADWQVCSILKKDPVFDALQGKKGRPPLAILRHALTGNLMEKPFIPLGPVGQRSKTIDRHPRIGIAWASISNNRPINQKSVPLKQFIGILDGIKGEFVSLQRNLKIADPDGLLRKFGAIVVPEDVLDTKSESSLDTVVKEISQLDCLVTISTTTTHIAASLGVRVLLIAAERKGPQWFWQVQANHQRCFYKTVQVHIGNGETGNWWESCLESVRSSLSCLKESNGCLQEKPIEPEV
ncbi:MAG: hypothetical protein IBX72_06985 [Nitrospirae bacterium]|nr:hypothetical protein [Nitrospirota bacterium]